MKKKISLKFFALISLLPTAAVLIIGYSVLSVRFFLYGMDNIIAVQMEHAVETFTLTVPGFKQNQLNTINDCMISREWERMPDEIKRVFGVPKKINALVKYAVAKGLRPPEKIYFLMHFKYNNYNYYVVKAMDTRLMPGLDAIKYTNFLIIFSLVMISVVSILVIILVKKIENPLKKLSYWAQRLNDGNLNSIHPDFYYPELNDLATLIQKSLSSVQESLEREKTFLRHSSHELRTPITIIRNNVELLSKLKKNSNREFWAEDNTDVSLYRKINHIFERIDRASLTMKYLTETLLWLEKESAEDLPMVSFDVEQLVLDIISSMKYMLKEKNVNIITDTSPFIITTAEIPARIVMGNLIRNAFQHSLSGDIKIIQEKDKVEIVNDMDVDNNGVKDIGFGLGIMLTLRLTRKLNWPYYNRTDSGKYFASVRFLSILPNSPPI